MSRSRWIALVALSEPTLPEASALLENLSHRPAGTTAPRLASQTAGALNLVWDADEQGHDATANVTLVDKPIPWQQLEGPCVTAWYWPEAESVLRQHTAHLFVTLIDENPKGVQQSFRLTRLLTALAAVSPAAGIVWGASGAVHEPVAFSQLASKATAEDLPLNLWIDFRVYEKENNEGFGLFTTGLDALGHREFEVPNFTGDPHQLVGAVYNVTHYLLEKQPTLRDSEVIGLPNEQEVTIHEDQSQINPEQDVLRLEFK